MGELWYKSARVDPDVVFFGLDMLKRMAIEKKENWHGTISPHLPAAIYRR